MLLPVGRGQIGIADWISGMIHLMVSHIDSYMGNIVAGIVSGMEKDQIASLCLCQRDMLGCVILCQCGSWQADSGFSVAPLSKTRTVKRSVWITATIDIFPALILQRFIHNRLYRFVAKLLHSQILVDQLHIEHIPVVITPATIFTDCYWVRIGHFCTAGFILCEILCKVEAVLFPILCYIVSIATAIVIRLNDHVNVIYAFCFTGRKQGRKIFTPLLNGFFCT